jgi:hypothetical protein
VSSQADVYVVPQCTLFRLWVDRNRYSVSVPARFSVRVPTAVRVTWSYAAVVEWVNFGVPSAGW